MEKKTRVEFLYETTFKSIFKKAVKRNQLDKFDNRHEGFTSLHQLMVYNEPEDFFYDRTLWTYFSNREIEEGKEGREGDGRDRARGLHFWERFPGTLAANTLTDIGLLTTRRGRRWVGDDN